MTKEKPKGSAKSRSHAPGPATRNQAAAYCSRQRTVLKLRMLDHHRGLESRVAYIEDQLSKFFPATNPDDVEKVAHAKGKEKDDPL